MRHKVDKKRFSRRKSHREAMLKNLACSLILHEKIETTEAKAKVVRRLVERLIKKSQEGQDLRVYRYLLEKLPQKQAAKKLINEIGKRYKGLNSGFINIYRIGERKGDGAVMVLMELKKLEIEKNNNKEENIKKDKEKNSQKNTKEVKNKREKKK